MTVAVLATPEGMDRKPQTPYYGLTKLGYAFCNYINHYKSEETNEVVRKKTISNDSP